MHYNPELLFNNKTLSDYINEIKNNIIQDINKEDESYILNIGEEKYISHLNEKYIIENISLDVNAAYVEPTDEDIRAEDFPQGYNIYSGKSYSKPVFYFHLPFVGTSDLLFMQASTFTFNPPRALVKNNTIIYKYIQFDSDIEKVNTLFYSFVDNVSQTLIYTTNDVENFNNSLETFIKVIFSKRKEELVKRQIQLDSLKMPIKKRNDVPSTFVIPSPKIKKKVAVKPLQTSTELTFDPTLDNETYMDILKIINDMGKEFERKPSVYSNKGEEDLRDHYLMMLEPNFEGSATGETFNKSGKTDILLRYQGANVFVGECKFWSGQSGFLKTIDQLLAYLTWRDSKTAVIMFVKNKDFSNVVNIAKEVIQSHPNFVRYNNDFDESWSNYTFHINGDANKEIKLALMLYHTPLS